jgi:hypothetical protein
VIGILYAALGWMAVIGLACVGWFVFRRIDRGSARILKAITAPFDERTASLVRSVLAAEPLLRDGQPARGKIVNVTGAGVTFQGDDNDVVRVVVEVTPPGMQGGATGPSPTGAAPYTAECTMWILSDDRPNFEPGTEHEVRIDPQDPKRIALAGTPFDTLRWVAQRSSWGDKV